MKNHRRPKYNVRILTLQTAHLFRPQATETFITSTDIFLGYCCQLLKLTARAGRQAEKCSTSQAGTAHNAWVEEQAVMYGLFRTEWWIR